MPSIRSVQREARAPPPRRCRDCRRLRTSAIEPEHRRRAVRRPHVPDPTAGWDPSGGRSRSASRLPSTPGRGRDAASAACRGSPEQRRAGQPVCDDFLCPVRASPRPRATGASRGRGHHELPARRARHDVVDADPVLPVGLRLDVE
ncbi:hypothetical protein PAHAL_3G083700 [Panicum hallii]|uniref:Uncharacterized protein n=1 Tax=Panicum hallii TaxID=206008 RepID=A0A2T8KHI7_9POAL|nr:hypothetical protein PAHAL_3G083700 [Panicum hallii]